MSAVAIHARFDGYSRRTVLNKGISAKEMAHNAACELVTGVDKALNCQIRDDSPFGDIPEQTCRFRVHAVVNEDFKPIAIEVAGVCHLPLRSYRPVPGVDHSQQDGIQMGLSIINAIQER